MKPAAIKPVEKVPVDWSAASPVDHSQLDTGVFKFTGTSENRSLERISQRELGKVDLSVRVPGKDTWIRMKLWDFTSISFGVVHQTEDPDWPAPAGVPDMEADKVSGRPSPKGSPVEVGDEVELRIQVTHHQEFLIWCQVKNTAPCKDGIKIGLRRMDVDFPRAIDVERRESFRLPMAPTLALNARVKHPFIFGHMCPLSVSDINKDMGLSFRSQDPSLLVFEGMELQVHFELASHRDTPMTVRVTWVHVSEASHVRFGVACVDMTWRLHNKICEFLLFSRQWTPAKLRQAGFRAQQVKGRLRFRTVKTMDEYAEVLYLRRDSYVGAGKKPEGTRPEDMAGNLDGVSRILMAHHEDRLVGTMTFTFPVTEETILDSQSGFPGRKFPVTLPPLANLIEVSRLCIHEDYRSTDLLQGMFEHGVKHCLMSDRHWLLTSAVTELLPTYLRIGFRRLKASYKHPALNNKEHHLILAHRDSFLFGQGMNVLVWNTLFGDLIEHLLETGLVRVSPPVRALIRLKLLLRPLSKRLVEGKADNAFRKHLQSLRRTPLSPPNEPEGDGPDGQVVIPD
jgi:hypothetical protein